VPPDDDPPETHPMRLAHPEKHRPKHPKKDYDRLVKAAWDAGWWCIRHSNNYIYCHRPSDNRAVPIKSSPRKIHTLNDTVRQLRKLGLDV
jgi:hypothetical protein